MAVNSAIFLDIKIIKQREFMKYLDLLKKNKVKVDELPYELQSQIGDYNVGMEKVEEAESLELGHEDLQALNEQKEQLAELHLQIINEIEVYLATGNTQTTNTEEQPVKKRGRKPLVKEIVTEVKEPAKRGRKSREVAPVVEDKEPSKRGRKPIVKEDAPIEVKEPSKRGRKPRADKPIVVVTDEAPSTELGSEKKAVKQKEIANNRRNRNVQHIGYNRRNHSEEDDIILSEKERKHILLKLEEANKAFYPLEEDLNENQEEVSQLQEEIAGEFDRVEKMSSNKRKLFWGILCALGAGALAIGGINLIKESK